MKNQPDLAPNALRMARRIGWRYPENAVLPVGAGEFKLLHRCVNPFNIEFLKAMTETDSNGCWNWIGTRCTDGYGMVSFFGKRYGTHRVSYFVEHGAFPDPLLVLHVCDNAPCINPEHLYAGTHKQNAIDAVRRSNKADIRLSEREVSEIRRLYSHGKTSQLAIANSFAVTQPHISRITRHITWAHTT